MSVQIYVHTAKVWTSTLKQHLGYNCVVHVAWKQTSQTHPASSKSSQPFPVFPPSHLTYISNFFCASVCVRVCVCLVPTWNKGDPNLHSPVGGEQQQLQQLDRVGGLLVGGHASSSASLFAGVSWKLLRLEGPVLLTFTCLEGTWRSTPRLL